MMSMRTEPTPTAEYNYPSLARRPPPEPWRGACLHEQDQLFRAYCAEHGWSSAKSSPRERENCFTGRYAQRWNLEPQSLGLFRNALQSLNRIYHRTELPDWRSPRPAKRPATP
ncbi:hypothetical protein MesoLj113c_68320 [Mesorhizobium sp. 113-3-9]|nr:hypothetical protein MesoLj113c_68320 [Mesorhizobium sp. 113-3-9]